MDDGTHACIAAATRYVDRVMLSVEGERRRWELEQHKSLRHMIEILDTCNMTIGITDRNCKGSKIRMLAYGGTSGLFGYTCEGISVCPNCGTVGGYTIPHLVEECAALHECRLECWQEVNKYLTREGIVHEPPSVATWHMYYRLTMGASVPNSMIELGLDADTHFARKPGTSAKGHIMRNHRIH